METGIRVIAAVEKFFEEDLSTDIAERAGTLAADQREALREDVQQALRLQPEDVRPAGHVRPFLYRSYKRRILVGAMAMKNGYVPLPPLEHLLLYFHSVAVFDTLSPALAGAHGETGLSWALRWLNEASPLIRLRLLVLCDSRIEDRQIGQRHQTLIDSASEFSESDERRLWEEMCAISGDEPGLDERSSEKSWPFPPLSQISRAFAGLASNPHPLDVAIWDTQMALRAAMSSAGLSSDLWIADGSYAPVLAETLGRANAELISVAHPPSARLNVMTKLSNLALPAIERLSVHDLIAIRKNEELFEDWRTALTSALADLPPSGEPNPAQLRSVDEHLRDGAARLNDQKKQLSRDMLTGEMRDFGIASLASATSGVFFGMDGLAAAVTASGAASVLRTAHKAFQVRREQQQLESAGRHYAVFAPLG